MNERDQRIAVVAEARSFIGTRWLHRGRVKHGGIDCVMLLAEVYENTGVLPHVEPEPYPADGHLHSREERVLRYVERYAVRRPEGERAEPGDIALFRYGRSLSHAAIVIDHPIVIHAQIHLGVILDDLTKNSALVERLAGFWNPWGVTR